MSQSSLSKLKLLASADIRRQRSELRGQNSAGEDACAPGDSAKPKLLDQVRTVIRRKHYSIRTEDAYVDWIKR